MPGALLLWGAGAALAHAQSASPFAQSVGYALRSIGTIFLAMYGFSWLFDARGVAVKHFLWPSEAMTAVKRAIRRFMLVYVPVAFVALMNSAVSAPHPNRESLGRIAFIFAMAALAVFVWRLFRRSGPVMKGLLPEGSRSWPARLYPLWAGALVALPIVLGAAAAAGFYFAAGVLYRLIMQTLLLVLGAVVLYGMIALWVLIQRARLSRRQAAQPEGGAVQVVSEGSTTLRPVTLDVATLGERTSHLLNLVTTLLLLAGVWAIWQDWVPFLSAIGDVQLWTYSDAVQGEQVTRALTIRGLVLALLTLVLTYVAATNIGAVLDIVVLQRLELQRDITYGIKTVLRYAIAVVGLVVASNILGVSWSKAQWLVAALGVGLGFGLQEIVANFVSGLIVLGERPIRVGDVVTVGDVTGTVTSIRARATVVTDFDNKEIMIPNKAFITERVINWTLSDQTTRLLIPVGVAYGTDVERAQRVMLAAVESIADVLREPAPSAFFVGFGDSSLDFEIRAFVDAFDKRLRVRHDIHVAVARALADAGIEIPFPQRDLHIRSAEGLEPLVPRAVGRAD
jgi:potassium efflux system protein